jgi:tRNA threonylcarbamoyladenosine modification (KEOPS) complex  Pcc1 subunit
MEEYYARVDVDFPPGTAEKVLNAITPEMGSVHERRSTAAMNTNKNILSLEIKAQDLTALKASFNSYMKLMILCNKLQEA